ncbi:MAG: O-antigen ligase family protein [Proteobacteria bacterium]|nr:O-antigen ligase family protein [Pseudomonadota bacterium]
MKSIMLLCIAAYASLLGGYLSPAYGILIFFILTIILFLWFSPSIKIKKDVLVVLIFSLYAAASALWAEDKWASIMFSSSLLSGGLLYLMLRNYENWEDRLLFVLVFCGVINAALGAFQAIHDTPKGFFYNPNTYSGFLTPLIPLSMYLYWKYKKTSLVWITSFLIFSDLMSTSRAGILSMFLSLLVVLYFLFKSKEKKAFIRLIFGASVAFAFYLIFPYILDLFMTVQHNAISPVNATLEKGTKSIVQKYYQHQDTLKLFLKSPFFGHGINSYLGLIKTIANPYLQRMQVHTHNMFLNILVELGIIGFIFFALFVIIVLKRSIFSTNYFFKAALFAYLFHNLVEYNFPAPPFQVIFYTLAALIVTETDSTINFIEVKAWMKKAANYSILIFFFALIVPQYIGFYYLNKAKNTVESQDIDGAYKYLFYASSFSYASSMVQESMADFLSQIYMSSKQKSEQLSQDTEKYYLKALNLNSVNGEIYIGIAKFYFNTGKHELSERYLVKATELFPYNQMYKIEMANFYKATGRFAESVKLLMDVDKFLSKYAPLDPLRILACLKLAECSRAEGNLKLYRNYSEKAERLKGLAAVKQQITP